MGFLVSRTKSGRVVGALAFALMVDRRQRITGNLVVVTHGLVCGAMLTRHARVSTAMRLPERVG